MKHVSVELKFVASFFQVVTSKGALLGKNADIKKKNLLLLQMLKAELFYTSEEITE